MANSKVGQYQLEYDLFGFGAPVNSHKLRANVLTSGTPAIGTPPASVDILLKGGTTKTLQDVADQVWSFFRLMYPSSVNAASFTLWRWVTNNARDFVSAGNLATPLGSGAAAVTNWQATLTFRSGSGGIGKLVFIEPNQGGNLRAALTPNAAGTTPQRIAAFALSADSPFQALDNGFFVSSLRDNRGENEAIRNRRLGVS